MVALAVGAPDAAAELLSVKLDADEISFSYDRKRVTLTGHARIFGQVVEDPFRFVKMRADLIEGDLTTGRFELLGDVLLVTPEASLSGHAAAYEAETSRYSLHRGGVMMPIKGPEQERVFGYAYARELHGDGDIVYVTNGVFTTCDRPDPDFALRAHRLRYNAQTGSVRVRDGSIRLYDLTIPLLVPEFTFTVGGEPEQPTLLPLPGYSSADGVRVGWRFSFGERTARQRAHLSVKLTQRRGIRGSVQGLSELDHGTLARVRISRKEDVPGDLDRATTIDRLPELGLRHAWDSDADRRLEVQLSAGRYSEVVPVPDGPDTGVDYRRARLEARYTDGYEARDDREGRWWWVESAGALYDDGQSYGHVGAGLGASAQLTEAVSGSLELSHRVVGGATPFEFDDIDIETELDARARARLSSVWGAGALGRFDLDRGQIRDWELELRRRAHCLTWTAGYRKVGGRFSVGVEINGLTGGTEPPPQRSLDDGPPQYWEHRAPDETGSGAGQQHDAPSGATQ